MRSQARRSPDGGSPASTAMSVHHPTGTWMGIWRSPRIRKTASRPIPDHGPSRHLPEMGSNGIFASHSLRRISLPVSLDGALTKRRGWAETEGRRGSGGGREQHALPSKGAHPPPAAAEPQEKGQLHVHLSRYLLTGCEPLLSLQTWPICIQIWGLSFHLCEFFTR